MTEPEFLCRLVGLTGCCVLLDVHNLYANSLNLHFNAHSYIDSLPLDRVRELHIAGGALVDDIYADTHARPACKGVWELAERIRSRALVYAIVLERDRDTFNSIDEIADELRTASLIMNTSISARQ